LEVLRALIAETGARAVHWGRLYDPDAKARDTGVKVALRAEGVEAVSHAGHLLFEPWTVQTGQGGFYKVYSPFWRAVKDRGVAEPMPAPKAMRGPQVWPASDALEDWQLGRAMNRGADVVAGHAHVGEAAAQNRLRAFLGGPVEGYKARRDFPAEAATSGLSENLTYGEIGPRDVWQGGMRALHEGRAGAEHFLKELVWREFAYHLLHHTPHIATRNWRPEWDNFAWRGDSDDAERWRRGMTGEPFVDAAMREMYVTGTMHNRARMIAASYLTKHLLTDWRVGLRWFEDCLIDWDPASNAMGWQWAAGSGPDAALFFRVFNPETQAEKFDEGAAYRHRFIAELARAPGRDALAYFDAVPRAWGLDAQARYPGRMVDLAEGRKRALAAYAERNSAINET
jgi:deoxyribodipyrimidine photo-lyase